MKATRKRARAKSAAKERKERSDKGIARTITQLRNAAEDLNLGIILLEPRLQKGSWAQPFARVKEQTSALFQRLDKLDGRMKVLIDPSKAEK